MSSRKSSALTAVVRGRRFSATLLASAAAILFWVPSNPWGVPLFLLLASVILAVALASPNETSSSTATPAVVWIAPAFAALLVYAVAIGLLASWMGLGLWNTSFGSALIWLALLVAITLVSWQRGNEIRWLGDDKPAGGVLLGMLGLGSTIAIVVPFEVWARIVNGGTDFGRHLAWLMKPVVESGHLSYSSSSYPRGLHALVGSVFPSMASGSYEDAWIAMEGTAWLLVALSATAIAVATNRLCSRVGLSSGPWRVACTVAAVAIFLQGATIDSFLRYGFLTSLLALLAVCSIAATLSLSNERVQIWQLGLITIALSHAWQLLVPVIAMPWLLLLIKGWRTGSHRVEYALVLLVSGLLSLPPLATLLKAYLPSLSTGSSADVSGDLGEAVANPGAAGLLWPDTVWIVAPLLTILTLVMLWRYGMKQLSLIWTGTLSASAVFIVGLWQLASQTNDLPYYVLKSLWTLLPLCLPTTVVGGALLLAGLLHVMSRFSDPVKRIASITVIASIALLAGAIVVGQMSGDTPRLARLHSGLNGIVYQLPAIAQLEREDISPTDKDALLFWGLAPTSGDDFGSLIEAGAADWRAVESVRWLDIYPNSPAVANLFSRDSTEICNYLKEKPRAMRLTGPNPLPGIQWLLDSGCPEKVVQPDSWQVIEIDDSWFEGREELLPYSYPS